MSAFLETIRFNDQAVYNLKPRLINSTSQNLYVGTLTLRFVHAPSEPKIVVVNSS